MPPVACTPPETGRDLVKRWKKTMAFTPDIDERAAIFNIVGQPRRLRLFYELDRVGEVCVCDLGEILGVTQSAVSQHLAKFKAYGLVKARRDGQTLYYSLSDTPAVKTSARSASAGSRWTRADPRGRPSARARTSRRERARPATPA